MARRITLFYLNKRSVSGSTGHHGLAWWRKRLGSIWSDRCLLTDHVSLLSACYLFLFIGRLCAATHRSSGSGSAGMCFANAVILPAILDVWVYSAGNLIKIRDNTELSYVLDEKDYPQEVFNKHLWQLEAYEGPNGLYSVRAFRQFRFGDILLICPGRYKTISLKEIGKYAHLCVTLSEAKVKVAAPVVGKDIELTPKPECIVTAQTPTPPRY